MQTDSKRSSFAITFALVALLSPAITHAQEDSAGWSVTCKVGTASFQIALLSPTGYVTDDNMQVRVSGEDQHFPAQWYMPAATTDETPSACDTTAAFAIDATHTLLLLHTSGRPGYDWLIATVLDSKGALTQPSVLGESNEVVTLIAASKGRSGKARVKAVSGLNSRVQSDGPDGYCFEILEVTGRGKTVSKRWLAKPPAYCKPLTLPKL